MPSFFSRRYIRGPDAVGRVEKALAVALPLLLLGVAGLYVGQTLSNRDYLFDASEGGDPLPPTAAPEATASALAKAGGAPVDAPPAGESPFPDPGSTSWNVPRQVSRFTPDNLYEKIDGRVTLYLQYHVAGLTFGAYRHESDASRTIDVYRYDMGQPENALGIYRTEAPEDATAVDIGQQAYAAGGAVFFIKGAEYVQVLPTTLEENDAHAALEIARRIGESITDASGGPWALAVLPAEGRVADSFQYLSEDAFGLGYLKDVFTAEYERDGTRVTLFIHKAADEAEVAPLLDRYAAYFEEYGEIAWRDPDSARRIVAGDAAGVIDVVFVKGPYLGGVAGADDRETANQAAVMFFDGLATPP